MSADEILPGVDVATLRGRFLALGGRIYKHRGDDRWVAPGQKPVRVHSGRQDATRALIRLVRRLEAGAPPELRARARATRPS